MIWARRAFAAIVLLVFLGGLSYVVYAAVEAMGDAAPRGDGRARATARNSESRPERAAPRRFQRVVWRRSLAIGLPWAGRLERGVRLPAEGRRFFTWDPVRRRSPNRSWRLWGTARLVRTLLRVLAAVNARRRIGIGDLSRPRGGDFGPQYGLPGHASHQNGLDADVYLPRRDGRERPPESLEDVDRVLSQRLVDAFVRAGAIKVFVGHRSGLRGPPSVVQAIPRHETHLHVRLAAN